MKKISLPEIKKAFVDFKQQRLENTEPTREKTEEVERRLYIVEDFITFLKETHGS